MFNRKIMYEKKDQTSDNLEKLTKKFSSDLRKQIQKIKSDVDFFGKEFKGTRNLVEHISKIAAIETKPTRSNYGTILTFSKVREKKTKKTLWEKEEFTTRYIVEEGKVNVLLRLCIGFKKKQKYWIKNQKGSEKGLFINMKFEDLNDFFIKECVLKGENHPKKRFQYFKEFEANIGTLLACVFTSVEAVQTLNLKLLVDYVDVVLFDALKLPQKGIFEDFSRSGEFHVINFLSLVLNHISELEEDKLENLLFSKNLLSNLVSFLGKYHSYLNDSENLTILTLISQIMDTEVFQTGWNKISKEWKKSLINLNEQLISKVSEKSQSNKKKLRTLSNMIIRFKM